MSVELDNEWKFLWISAITKKNHFKELFGQCSILLGKNLFAPRTAHSSFECVAFKFPYFFSSDIRRDAWVCKILGKANALSSSHTLYDVKTSLRNINWELWKSRFHALTSTPVSISHTFPLKGYITPPFMQQFFRNFLTFTSEWNAIPF